MTTIEIVDALEEIIKEAWVGALAKGIIRNAVTELKYLSAELQNDRDTLEAVRAMRDRAITDRENLRREVAASGMRLSFSDQSVTPQSGKCGPCGLSGRI